MNIFKTVCALGVATAAILPQQGWSQNTVTDEFGTTYITDTLPPTLQGDIATTRQARRNGAQGPLQVTGRDRFRIAQNQNYTGTAVGNGGSQEEELLVNQLLGVVLVPTPGDVRQGGWHGVEGVWHDFKDFPPEVGWALQEYLNEPVSLTSLDRMVKDVIVAYREGDRPVVDVLLPEQDITSGVVQLVVIQSKLSRIRVEGVDVDTEEYIRSQMRVRKGEVIRSSEILHDLAWLNRSPYRKVDLAYAPGRDFGTTDVILKPYTTKKNSVFVGYEDSGTEFLGRERLVTGFNLGEFGQPGRSLAYQFSSDFDFEHVRANSVVYSHDLPWRHNLTFLASFVDIDTQFPIGVDPTGVPINLESSGFNWQLSLRYNIPLKGKETEICPPLFGTIQRRRDAYLGFDFKSNENDLEFGGTLAQLGNQLGAQTEVYQFTAGYKEIWQHPGGVSQFDIAGFVSPGNWTPHNSDEEFFRSRPVPGIESNYTYATASFEHQHRLMQDWSMRAKIAGQITGDSLVASEQIGIGGYSTIRGFDAAAIRGDQGVWGTFELYAPELSLGRIFDWPNAHGPCTDSLRLLSFFDAGSVSDTFTPPGSDNSQNIASVGVGMRYTYNDFFRLRVDYGHPVKSDTTVDLDTSGRFHIGATATF